MTGSTNIPPLVAVILAGGQSKRMGTDKAWLNYHGKPNLLHLRDQLEQLELPTYISSNYWPSDQACISHYPDHEEYSGHGPISGLLTIHKHVPECALLLLGCDYPNIKQSDIIYLIKHRNPLKSATAFESENGMAEPLCTIYEPIILGQMKEKLKQDGNDSLQRHLQANQYESLPLLRAQMLQSMDRIEDYEQWINTKRA